MDPFISTVLLADDSQCEIEQGFLWYYVISTAQDHTEGKKNAPYHSGIVQQLIRAA